jgi:hypothetical protein
VSISRTLVTIGDTVDLGGGEAVQVGCVVVQLISGGGTVVVEGSQDGATWTALIGQDLNAGTSANTGVTGAGNMRRYDVSGIAYVRGRCTVAGSTLIFYASGTLGARV